MPLLPTSWYHPVHLICVFLLTVLAYHAISICNNNTLLYGRKKYSRLIFLYAILFIVVVGLRPAWGREFGDSGSYASIYTAFQEGLLKKDEWIKGDWLWAQFMFSCSQIMSVNLFFLVVEFLYVFPLILACKRWSQDNSSFLLLFAFGAFSFFAYATNGLRNGMACSLVTLALTYISGNKKDKIVCVLLCLVAILNHKAALLPVSAMLFTYLLPKPKPMFIFWVSSIIISIFAGGAISVFFESLGLDDRMITYLDYSNSEVIESFSRTGFRWDFLLYSFMPILMGWYVVFRRKTPVDLNYLILLGTYIYSNSFWVMVIRAAYSNRFAYLSWFLYPFVLAYPLLKFDVIPRQGRRLTGLVMILQLSFTIIMYFR